MATEPTEDLYAMNRVIQDYCKRCEECAIRGVCDSVKGQFLKNERACKEAYAIVTALNVKSAVSDGGREEINHPDRYKGEKFECIDVMQEVFGIEAVKAFYKLNAFKYIWRADKKNGAEDIKKAVWYLNKLIELEGTE